MMSQTFFDSQGLGDSPCRVQVFSQALGLSMSRNKGVVVGVSWTPSFSGMRVIKGSVHQDLVMGLVEQSLCP